METHIRAQINVIMMDIIILSSSNGNRIVLMDMERHRNQIVDRASLLKRTKKTKGFTINAKTRNLFVPEG